jgi:hypothetical protein
MEWNNPCKPITGRQRRTESDVLIGKPLTEPRSEQFVEESLDSLLASCEQSVGKIAQVPAKRLTDVEQDHINVAGDPFCHGDKPLVADIPFCSAFD